MISDTLDKVVCPKCGATENDIFKFDRNVYIVRDNNEFVRTKLYGCHKCENLFAYATTPRKETKNMGIQNIFSKLSKQCDNALNNITIKN